MRNKILVFVLIFIVIIIIAFFNAYSYQKIPNHSSVVMINDLIIEVEVAENLADQIKGLSNRDNLSYDEGMLFVYDDYKIRNFWMKEMRFPIDIIWIKDNQIIDIEKNAPVPTSQDIATFASPVPVNYVLEVNAGFAQKYGLKSGDTISIEL